MKVFPVDRVPARSVVRQHRRRPGRTAAPACRFAACWLSACCWSTAARRRPVAAAAAMPRPRCSHHLRALSRHRPCRRPRANALRRTAAGVERRRHPRRRRSGTACRTRRWCRSRTRSTSSRSGSSSPTSARTAANLKDKPVFVPDPNNQIIKSEKQTFRIEVVAPGLETPWGLAFLPDGRLLVTERPGRLRIIEKGKLLPDAVQGTPKVWERQDSGMLDVAIHPQYAKNGWIYLAYTEVVPGYVAPPPAPPAAPADPGGCHRRRGGGDEAGRPARRR